MTAVAPAPTSDETCELLAALVDRCCADASGAFPCGDRALAAAARAAAAPLRQADKQPVDRCLAALAGLRELITARGKVSEVGGAAVVSRTLRFHSRPPPAYSLLCVPPRLLLLPRRLCGWANLSKSASRPSARQTCTFTRARSTASAPFPACSCWCWASRRSRPTSGRRVAASCGWTTALVRALGISMAAGTASSFSSLVFCSFFIFLSLLCISFLFFSFLFVPQQPGVLETPQLTLLSLAENNAKEAKMLESTAACARCSR